MEAGARWAEGTLCNSTVGRCGYPDRDGVLTLDASIMDGDGRCGAEAARRSCSGAMLAAWATSVVGFVAIGLLLSALAVRETRHHVAAETKLHGELPPDGMPTQREVFWRTTLSDKNLSSVSQAGLVNNLNDVCILDITTGPANQCNIMCFGKFVCEIRYNTFYAAISIERILCWYA